MQTIFGDFLAEPQIEVDLPSSWRERYVHRGRRHGKENCWVQLELKPRRRYQRWSMELSVTQRDRQTDR